jgi:hypothetical protein
VHTPPLPFSNKTHTSVRAEGREHIVLIEELLRRFGVDGLLRLHSSDFAELPAHHRMFVHFNLEVTTNEVGRRYAVVPIVKPGRRLPDGRELLPIIDPSQRRVGTCVEVIQRVAIDQITVAQFSYSLPSIRTPQELREALLRRYSPMFPTLSGEEIVARGCAVTQIALDDR